MIFAYAFRSGRLTRLSFEGSTPPEDALWIDLFDPTDAEERAVEQALGVEVPTRQEMAAIEESSRIYRDDGAVVLTAVVVDGVARGRPSRAQITFVLTSDHLVTLRYVDPQPFKTFDGRIQRLGAGMDSPARIFLALLESIVERGADILELTAAELNEVSTRLFLDDEVRKKKHSRAEDEMQVVLKRLGRKNMTLAFLRESLMTLERVASYARTAAFPGETRVASDLKRLQRDLRSLSVYEAELSSELRYLHEAALGLVNLAQNRIIKVFSIASVLFLPPTVVGTVYGMNFRHMPELEWSFGYPLALGVMAVSATIPILWLRRKGWL